jgi:phosphoribosylaminoimidazolecarboxamide formyltransferase/IMP cyclohydrolase
MLAKGSNLGTINARNIKSRRLMASPEQNALLSVYDKTGIEKFAEGLVELDWKLYSSGGTADRIDKSGIPVSDIKELVGGAAILNHKVVTLSREIHGGILADESDEDVADLEREGIPRLGLVCVDMYPLEEEIANPNATAESVRLKTDVGGPTMLHSAAKGRRIVLSDATQREPTLEWLRNGQPNKEQYIIELAAAAELAAAEHIMASARYLGKLARTS